MNFKYKFIVFNESIPEDEEFIDECIKIWGESSSE